jgi:translation initiation factor IF-2
MESKQKSQNKIQVPIVAILGHVNHGKTSILDYIRKTSVQLGEAGGITQKISVFTINPSGDDQHFITFVDTPGHEAFDLMRLRGGKVADIVLLIVAANDGVQPQTIESIDIINSSNVKPIVVINKIDLPGADIPKIKRDLATRGLMVEGMGGSVPVVEVSAKTGAGISELMDMILLLVDVEGLKPAEKLPEGVTGKGFVLESVKDKSMGFVASVIVTEGVFEKGSWFAYRMGTEVLCEKLKGFITEEGKNVEKFEKGFGGKIIGLSHLVDLGAEVYLLKDKDMKLAESLLKVDEKAEEVKSESSEEMSEFFADFFAESDKKSEEKVFKIIIKSSSEGSLEAIKKSISKIPLDGVRIEVAKEGIGDICISDIETVLSQVSCFRF